MPQVEVVRSGAALDALHAEWSGLEARAGLAHPFLGADWTRAWWRSFGADGALRLVLARRGSELAGALPLRADVAALGRRLPFLRGRRLSLFQNGCSDRSGALVAGGDADTLAAMFARLAELRAEWDFMDLRYLPAPELDACESALRAAGLAWERFPSEPCFRLDLAASMQDFLAAQTGHFRKRLRESRLRLEKAGAFAVRRFGREIAGAETALGEFLAVDARSWRVATGTTIGGDPQARAFYGRVAAEFAARDELDLRLLDLDGRAIAGILCVRRGAAAFGLKTSYDEEFQRLSPGSYLLQTLIEDCHERGLRRFDFIRGDDGLRRRWTEDKEEFGRLVVFSPSRKGRVYSFVRMQIVPRLRRLPGGRPTASNPPRGAAASPGPSGGDGG